MKSIESSHRTMLAWVAVLGLGTALPAYAQEAGVEKPVSFEQVRQQTREWLATLQNYAVDQRDEAIDDTRSLLRDIDTRIEALQDRVDRSWDRMDQATRDRTRAGLKELRQQRIRVAEWYGRLHNSSSEAWETMKKGMSDAYRALYGAWQEAEKEFQ